MEVRSRPAHRRRWKRTPTEKRHAAGTSLGDLFRPRGRRGWLLVCLVGSSILLHLMTLPLVSLGGARDVEDLAMSTGAYLRKVQQKERALHVAADIALKERVTPPPADPEEVVTEVLTESLTKDVVLATSDLLDVKLEKELRSHVERKLKDEIEAASREIASGKVSKEEIKRLRTKWQKEAYVAAKDWGEAQREIKQLGIAEMSTTEWYEARVSPQLKKMIRERLFFGRVNIWGPVYYNASPGFLGISYKHPNDSYPRLLDIFGRLPAGNFLPYDLWRTKLPDGVRFEPVRGGGSQLPGWPAVSAEQAESLLFVLRHACGAWERACSGYIRAYYPHRAAELTRKKDQFAPLVVKIQQQAEAYFKRAKAGAGKAALEQTRQACLSSAKALHEQAAKSIPVVAKQSDLGSQYNTITRAVRSRVLRGTLRRRARKYMINRLIQEIKPAVESLAQTQYTEGIVYSKKGVKEAIDEFRAKSVTLLRRDIDLSLSASLFDRKLFDTALNPYRSAVAEESCPASERDIERDEKALAAAVAKWPEAEKAFVGKRAEVIEGEVMAAIKSATSRLLKLMVTRRGLLERNFYLQADTVDYADHFIEALQVRELALMGRKQNLADLTPDGTPDTSNPAVALSVGLGAGQVSVKPVLAGMYPDYMFMHQPAAAALRAALPVVSPPPARYGFVTQAKVTPPFKTPNFEAIPFLANFPNLDGDLSDWGTIRPLLLRQDMRPEYARDGVPAMVYAAWNYQGFFFGYRVKQPKRFFKYVSHYVRTPDGLGLIKRRSGDVEWTCGGDVMWLCLDTLNARLPVRGDRNSQEFYIFPAGTESDPSTPGAERIVESRRYGRRNLHDPAGWGSSRAKVFPPQPGRDVGPDGSGPYRVARRTEDGYTVEIFLPRSLFNHPVFAPGWYIGFDCQVAIGRHLRGTGQHYNSAGWVNQGWPGGPANKPDTWGDLLLLGTDAEVRIQDAEPKWSRSRAVVPGRSYLVTVIDPDRNVHVTDEDTVLISVEVLDPSARSGGPERASDIEVLILKETGPNTSTYRGCINTQPGRGGEVLGTVEAMPGQEVRFGYADFADSQGRRNVIREHRLPVVSLVATVAGSR